ncbi:MAG: hypothetical protein ACI91B_000449 [Planctomycetota bacterium]|jgi:hypothetical protein
MWRKPAQLARKQHSMKLWAATLILANISIWHESTQLNPPWIGFSLSALAGLYACWRLVPGRDWAITPLWSTGCVIVHLAGPFEYEWLLWVIGGVLFVRLWSRRAVLQCEAEKRARDEYRAATND